MYSEVESGTTSWIDFGMLLALAVRFNLPAACEGVEAVSFGLQDADAALSESSIGKASISVTVGVIVIGAARGSLTWR